MLKHIADVVAFSTSQTAAVEEILDHPNALSGPFTAKTWPHYKDGTGEFTAGVWEAEASKEAFASEHEEFCHILNGTVRLTDKKGESRDYGVNETFVIPLGFAGVWENIGTVKKLFVIWTPNKQ